MFLYLLSYNHEKPKPKGTAMLSFLSKGTHSPPHSEGELFKKIEISGVVFTIYYGYYEQYERDNPHIDPMPIYPDFIKQPVYTKDGQPFVTKMQDGCIYFNGKPSESPECAECKHFIQGEDFIGTCACEHNRNKEDKK